MSDGMGAAWARHAIYESALNMSVFVTVSNNTVVFIYGVSQNRWFVRSGEIIAEISLREGRKTLKIETRSTAFLWT